MKAIPAPILHAQGFYICSYYPNNCRGSYGHYVWANNEDEAKSIVSRFGFDFEGYSSYSPSEYRPSVLALQPGGLYRNDVLHAICFLTFLADKAGIIGPDETCGDQSAIHDIIHFRGFPAHIMNGAYTTKTLRNIAEKIDFLEKNVPGVPPPSIKLTGFPQPGRDKNSDPFVVSDWLTPE